jgi:hypothetical protein
MVSEDRMHVGTIQRLINILNQAFTQLEADIPLTKLESLAVTIHRAMTSQTRYFHTLEHVFKLADLNDPIQAMAALFHDIVYYQVDNSISPEVLKVLRTYMVQVEDEFFIADPNNLVDRLYRLVLRVFDFRAGQSLSPYGGLNEFLSAMLMVKKLEGFVPEKDLLKMTVCIEATIPFRGKNERGETHFDVLEDRLRAINDEFRLNLSENDIIETVRLGVVFSNKDVENFSYQDASWFLENTWKLLPETNVALRSAIVYTIRDYRIALQKMEGFLRSLNPGNVFNSYRGTPPEEEYRAMTERARRNITIAGEYLGVKLLAAAMLEALAECSGGNAPLSLFMGDIARDGEPMQRMEDFLPETEIHDFVDHSSPVFILMEAGRVGEASFDMVNAPLALYLYKNLSSEQMSRLLERARDMFNNRITPQTYLAEVPPHVTSDVAQALAVMVFTRRKKLMEFVK